MNLSIFGAGYVGSVSGAFLRRGPTERQNYYCLGTRPQTQDRRHARGTEPHPDGGTVAIRGHRSGVYPVAMEEAERIYGKHASLTLCGDKYAALQGADALVICTEWQQFRVPDFAEMATRMRSKVIVDGETC